MIFLREIFKLEKGEFVEYFNVCFRMKWILIFERFVKYFFKIKSNKKNFVYKV